MLDISFYCPRWGSEDIPWDRFCKQVKEAGFDGVEVYPLAFPNEKEEMLHQLAANGLAFSLLHAEMKEGKDFEGYKFALERNLNELVTYQNGHIKPQFITTQTGREYYTQDQMEICFAICDRISKESGLKIIQETHRNKWSYAAHIVKDYLEKFPSLVLALDISHWICVSESYLEDQEDAIDLAIKHTVHLHARVGHIEGPQVTDPRAEENQEALARHLEIWDKWIVHLRKNKISKCTITPEFGPYPYMSYKNNTTTPVASQWGINCFMKNLLKSRYDLKNETT
jgi:sugar phosphate isomerase/epimerase